MFSCTVNDDTEMRLISLSQSERAVQTSLIPTANICAAGIRGRMLSVRCGGGAGDYRPGKQHEATGDFTPAFGSRDNYAA